jgi:hypothetical protein
VFLSLEALKNSSLGELQFFFIELDSLWGAAAMEEGHEDKLNTKVRGVREPTLYM